MQTQVQVKPFLKWVGGKRWLVPYLGSLFPEELKSGRLPFVEPFLGGGAVLLHCLDNFPLPSAEAYDINRALIAAYKHLQSLGTDLASSQFQSLELGWGHLMERGELTPEQLYYDIRDRLNTVGNVPLDEFLYLNYNSYRGLWRVNKKGENNTPFGHYKKLQVPDLDNLEYVAKLFGGWGGKLKIERQNFFDLDFVTEPKFWFIDPPYLDTFSGYSSDTFTLHDLVERLMRLDIEGHAFLLTYSNSPDLRSLLPRWWHVSSVQAPRKIGGDRGGVTELVVANYNY